MDRPEELEFAWLMLIGISLTFLLSLAVVAFFVYYQRRMFANRADMERLRHEEQEKRLKAVMDAQENERSRIARDLHDEVGVMLSTVKLYLTHKDQKDAFAKAEHLLDDAVSKLRAIARNLSPEHLAQFGFEKALDDLCEPLESTGELQVHRSIYLEKRLSLEQELQLHRMLQELLNNTLKHAQATEVHIDLTQENGSVDLRFRDNGVGFDLHQVDQLPSLGLRTLTGRVEILKGTLDIDSKPNQGTKIAIHFPRNTA